jgi:purine-binding chemotaxis protein CheW
MSSSTSQHLPSLSSKPLGSTTTRDFLTVHIAGQLFGIPILQVQDVLGQQRVTRIPLAPPQIAGSLNLRGRIVTALDVRKCLALPAYEGQKKEMSVVVEHDNELYSLIIDAVGDVLSLEDRDFEQTPATLDPLWRSVSMGIYRLEGNLLMILDVPKLLNNLGSVN